MSEAVLVRIPEAMRRLGIKSQSTFYDLIKRKILPSLVELYPGSKAKRMPSSDIEAHQAARIAARDAKS